ncbi:MAG: Hsp70 family protein [Desulfobacterales bacterium]|nr:Hsp70 family protein [Desulfobacterales bacterium]
MSDPAYIIGIDLGTTNSVVTYTNANIQKGTRPEINIFQIPQLVDTGTVEKKDVFPSFIFLPSKHEVSSRALSLPWNQDNQIAAGEFARDRGAEVPDRMISSSKSWLCHTMIDRNKPVLPWDGPEDIEKLSPVEASSVILKHIRDSWNYVMAEADESFRIENQEIYLTVPASFDVVARDLTVKAAKMAGFLNITLLEEPQAAFYAWIEESGDNWRNVVKKGDLILVCDVGGGTSDFTLIRVSENNGELALERVAVGNHLLVGGDNMDLALAYSVSAKMKQKGTKLDSWQMRGLCHSCRKAKEHILSASNIDTYPISILGRGSSLIGGTIRSDIVKDDVEKIIVDGFFPFCEFSSKPVAGMTAGLKEVGLSYASDPAITRHMADFLQSQKKNSDQVMMPTAVFFNGGVMKSSPVRDRIREVISSWNKDAGETHNVREIETKNFDLSVARGAAYYGLARRGEGIRIRAGLGKSYYIGVAASMPAVPGMPAPVKALCVAAFGMEEGTEAVLENREFALTVGEPVKFDFLGSAIRQDDKIGTIVEDWEDEIQELTFVETSLDGDRGSVIPVIIGIKTTEIGTLELWCISKEDNRKWKLEFNVREKGTIDS